MILGCWLPPPEVGILKWEVEFNVGECKILHISNRNPKHVYNKDGTELDDHLDLGKHIRNIVAKVNKSIV